VTARPACAVAQPLPARPLSARAQQVGAGGGMKGGVNIWVALRNTQDAHRAWMHVAVPYTEKDMPRPINEEKKPSLDASASSKAAAAAPKAREGGAAAAAAGKVFDLTASAAVANKAAAAAYVTRSRTSEKSAIAMAVQAEAEAEASELGVAAL
jgi:hypothetical protein